MISLRISVLFLLFMAINSNNIFSDTNINSTNASGKAVQSDPNKIFLEGLNKARNKQTKEAIKLLESLLNYNTENINYYTYLGYLEYVEGNYDKAEKIFLKALNINETLIIAHIVLGEIYYQMNDIIKAREEFETVLKINPNVKLAHIRLYELYKNNNTEIANKHYLKIFQLPSTKIENFLPDIKKIGSLNLTSGHKILLKDIGIAKKIKVKEDVINKILNTKEDKSNTSQVIVKVKKSKFRLNINLSFFSSPFKNFNIDKFYVKLVEFIIVSIFLIIYTIIKNRKEKALSNVVLNHFRTSRYNNKEI